MKKCSLHILAWCFALLSTPAVFSASALNPLLAGGEVLNKASLYYIDNATGLPASVTSNTVRAWIQSYEAGVLLQDQQQTRSVGTSVALKHRLVNTGNLTTSYSLRVENQNNDDFEVKALILAHDLNENGEIDSGETMVSAIKLAPGEAAELVVAGEIPGDANGVSRVNIVAFRGEREFARNTDTINVTAGALLVLNLKASTLTPKTGEVVDLVLNVQNVGNEAADGVNYQVDGQVESGLLIVQDIAPNTHLVQANAKVGRVLYRLDNQDSFTATTPVDLSRVTAVAYALDDLGPTEDADFVLKVQLNDNSSGDFPYMAKALYDNAVANDDVMTQSNEVILQLKSSPPEISYFSDASFTAETFATRLGAPLFLQVDASSCNKSATEAERVVITIRSEKSGDEESFLAIEQGMNTGVFRVPQAIDTMDLEANNVVRGNGKVETGKNDRLIATVADCGVGQAITSVLIDPEGIVFDSRSNMPVANAVVQLIDVDGSGNGGNPGAPAVVFLDDGKTLAPNRVTTGSDGSYRFPLVAASNYRLEVFPPRGFLFASSLAPDVMPAGRSIDFSGSYGGKFAVNTFTGAVKIDVPVDNVEARGIQVKKTVARKIAEIGDVVAYSVAVRNISGSKLFGIFLRDQLPPGFVYQNGSAMRDGVSVNNPAGANTSTLSFPLGSMEDDEETTITYLLAVSVGAQVGTNAVNRAQAQSAAPLPHISNLSTASVLVEGGVFDPHGFVLGKVFADCNKDGIQQDGELGVPGIRIWLENGNWALTDANGLYSFHGVTPQTHIAKVDSTSMPAGVTLLALSNRHADDGKSRFIDMKNGELHRADFAFEGCVPALKSEIELRIVEAKKAGSSAQKNLAPLQFSAAPSSNTGQASGVVGEYSGAAPTGASVQPSANTIAKSAPVLPLDKVAGQFTGSLDFIGLDKTEILTSTQINLRVKGPLDAQIVLKVNGEQVPDSKMGIRVEVADKNMEAREYIGVALTPGENRIELLDLDPNGRTRARRSVVLMAPGALHKIVIKPVQSAQAGEGKSAQIEINLLDSNGIAVAARTALSLVSDSGAWMVQDLDPVAPGHQVFVEGGRAVFGLQSPAQTGSANIEVSSGVVTAKSEINFVATLRDMIAVGLLEGVINFRKLREGILSTGNGNDGFEQEIQHFASVGNQISGAARAALFLKGKVKGEYLLTMAYDSDKPTQDKLFRDIQPDQYYPVYGDDSTKGFDAQSSGRLYLRLDKNKSWFLLGDFSTQQNSSGAVRKLSAYNRSLNGIRNHYDAGGFEVDSFASRETSRQVVEEIPANGTSGPYALKLDNLVGNSEKVEIVTRDRDQPAIVIRTVSLQRFVDYTLEPFSGRILFRAPVASVDENLNAQFVRVTYEVQQDGESYWVAGTEVRAKVRDDLLIGAAVVEDQYPQDPGTLRSVFARFEEGDNSLVAELASSDRLSVGSGNAARIEGTVKQWGWKGRFQVSRSDPAFSNASSTLSRGRTEARGKFDYSLSDKTRLIVDLLSSKDAVTGRARRGVFLGVERNFENNIKVQVGVRSSTNESSSDEISDQKTHSLAARVDAPAPLVPEVSLYGEAETAVGDSGKKLLAVGGDYKIAGKGRVYGRHEFISSLSGAFDLDSNQRRNTSVLGVDSEYMENGRVFSEYRARQIFSEREVEAAMGLRNRIPVSETLSFDTTFERVKAVTCQNCVESVAMTGAASYNPDQNTKATGRLELRDATNGRSVLSSQGLAHKLSAEWTMLARNIFLLNHSGQQRRLQDRFQLGVAFRDLNTNYWNTLARYEFKADSTTTAGAIVSATDYERHVHVFSAHANIQLSKPLVATFRYAGKFGEEQYLGKEQHTRGQLVSGRITYDLNSRWDLGLQGSVLTSNDSAGRRTAVGAEVGYLLQENQWLSVGYNVFGFKDRDLSGEDSFSKGLYVRFRLKFDEHLFEQFQ